MRLPFLPESPRTEAGRTSPSPRHAVSFRSEPIVAAISDLSEEPEEDLPWWLRQITLDLSDASQCPEYRILENGQVEVAPAAPRDSRDEQEYVAARLERGDIIYAINGQSLSELAREELVSTLDSINQLRRGQVRKCRRCAANGTPAL